MSRRRQSGVFIGRIGWKLWLRIKFVENKWPKFKKKCLHETTEQNGRFESYEKKYRKHFNSEVWSAKPPLSFVTNKLFPCRAFDKSTPPQRHEFLRNDEILYSHFFRGRFSGTVVLSHDLQQSRLASAKSSVPKWKTQLRLVGYWYDRRYQSYHIGAQYLIEQIVVNVSVWNDKCSLNTYLIRILHLNIYIWIQNLHILIQLRTIKVLCFNRENFFFNMNV